ncbi:gamma-aminobutyric acid receptor subunit alpha-1-like [Tubulanus polymorphus]|uniref:gamma-aminobutyric acid receptor subunit alpha-1-like n=1 Tax=Tubulanus polymorphus TaxID=672921 RepID=UPI003DA68AFF
MGPISEEQMQYTMDVYFRQKWNDSRLRFPSKIANRTIEKLGVSIKLLDKIWKPDTFIVNGQGSYLHMITYPNKLLRITSSGGVLLSMRLTIKANCPMNLKKYPMDNQTCPLAIGSYAYSNKDVEYRWMTDIKAQPVELADGVTMAQFILMSWRCKHVLSSSRGDDEYSELHVKFVLQRRIGYYILQVYLPCYLIVVISWVSFWINREATPARVTLGITTILTTSTIVLTGRVGIPKVPYTTALDLFLHVSFLFVFGALVEYAGVNYFTKTGKVDIPDSDDEDQQTEPLLPNSQKSDGLAGRRGRNGHAKLLKKRTPDSCWNMFFNCLKGNTRYREVERFQCNGVNSVSRIDTISRIAFPITFVIFNILYWIGYSFYM